MILSKFYPYSVHRKHLAMLTNTLDYFDAEVSLKKVQFLIRRYPTYKGIEDIPDIQVDSDMHFLLGLADDFRQMAQTKDQE